MTLTYENLKVVTSSVTNEVSMTSEITDGASSGTFTYDYFNDGTCDLSGFSRTWLTTTPDTSFAADHEIRWTGVSNFASENALTQNVWYALSSTRNFGMSGTQGVTDNTGSITIEIRKIGTTTPVYSATHEHTILGTG